MRVRIPIIASDAAPAAAPRDDPPKVRFARDSPLEGDGFEPSVPVAREPGYIAEGQLRGDRTGQPKKFLQGTDGSNPSPSSAESGANLTGSTTISLVPGARASATPALRGCAGLAGDLVGRESQSVSISRQPAAAYLAGYGQRLHFEVAGRIGSLSNY
jgi:hypothetical protein